MSEAAEGPTDAEGVRQRVDDLLVARFGRSSDAPDEAPSAVLDALSAGGLLSTEDRAAWERAFTAGALPDANAEALVAETSVATRAHALVEERAASDPEGVFGVVETLRDVGAISDEEAHAWQRKVITRSLGDGEREGTWRTVNHDLARFRGENLRTVVVGPEERKRGARVICVERYDDGVLVRWHFVRVEVDRSGAARRLRDEIEPVDRPLPPDFRLTDDVGTAYSSAGGGSHGRETDEGDYVAHGTAEFTPAVPPKARLLRLESRGAVFEVALS
jgi:hypothetical protein